jgi:hypothetical protein
MGKLIYDTQVKTGIDDRALAHLQIVMLNKLRRRESFAFSWKNPAARVTGAARSGSPPSCPCGSSTPAAARRSSTAHGCTRSWPRRTPLPGCTSCRSRPRRSELTEVACLSTGIPAPPGETNARR